MAFLKTLDSKFFHTEIPYKPMGKHVHLLTIRVTDSSPPFQPQNSGSNAVSLSGSMSNAT